MPINAEVKVRVHQSNKKASKKRINKKNALKNVNKNINHNLKCMFMNADVLTNKMQELLFRIREVNPDIIGINEVLPKNFKREIHKEEFIISGYELITNIDDKTDDNNIRGSIMYIRNGINYKTVEIKPSSENSEEPQEEGLFEEGIYAEINLRDNDTLMCGTMYRRGESSDSNNNLLLKTLLEISNKNYSHVAIMGDFNIKNIDWEQMHCHNENDDSFENRFIECTRDSFLFQNIMEPTRQRGSDAPSLLDLVFSNEENMIDKIEFMSPLGKSDHSVIKFEIKCEENKPPPKIKVLYEKGDYESMKNELDSIDWENELDCNNDNIEKQWNTFKHHFQEIEKKYIPKKQVYINGKLNKKLSMPLDKKTLKMIKKKNRLWSKKRKDLASEEEELQYKKLSNQIRRLTRKGKKLVEKNIANNAKANPKCFYKYAQSKLKSKSTIPDLLKPGTENSPEYVTTDKGKAEVYLSYFSSVLTDEPPLQDMPPFEERNYEEVLEDIQIDQDMILERLKKLKVNKAPGPDQIHPRVLKEIASSITLPLSIIYNSSIKLQTLPEEWKHANVSAIHKKGAKTLPQNYRPVSLTSIVCKTLEGIIREKVIKHMKVNNLFSPTQFGFIAGRSTILQLLHVLDIWSEILDQGGSLDVIYMDFMKAFDKVPHRRLIYKIEKYGIKKNALGWISSFLNNRTQQVVMNNDKSGTGKVTSGIPQGSVLGPILFVLYINDLPDNISKGSFIYLFADDTKVFREIKSERDIEILNHDVNELVKWSNIWLLRFHPDKCVFMNIGKPILLPERTYNMEGQPLNNSPCEKDLGVHIDDKLYFEKHIDTAVNKANKIVAIIRKTFDHMDADIFKMLFKSLVRPHLEYGAPVWSPHLDKHKARLEKVQERATKIIPGFAKLDYPARLQKLKMPTLAYRRTRGDMIQVFKMLNGKYDTSIPCLLTQNSTYLRGHDQLLLVKRPKKDIRKYNFSLRVINLWNSLPEKVIKTDEVKTFERNLDELWETQDLYYKNCKVDIDVTKYQLKSRHRHCHCCS